MLFKDKESQKKFLSLLDKVERDMEFEISLDITNSIDRNQIQRVYNYFSKDLKLEKKNINQLDINYLYDSVNFSIYRFTVSQLKNFKFINQISRLDDLSFLQMLKEYTKTEDFITLIKKEKKRINQLDIEEFDIRVRLSSETQEDIKNVSDNLSSKKIFRKKTRTRFIYLDEKNIKIYVDLTFTKKSYKYVNLSDAPINYEIEVEVEGTNFDVKKYSPVLVKLIKTIKKILQNSNNLIDNSQKEMVINKYHQLIQDDSKNNRFYSMNSVSLELKDLTMFLTKGYSVTDKADGDRNQLIIINSVIYLINNNLNVRKLGKIKSSKIDNCILDGEFVESEKVDLYMCFDCLVYKSKKTKDNPILEDRLKLAEDVIQEINSYSKSDNLSQYLSTLQKDIKEKEKNIKKDKIFNPILFRNKFFMFGDGINDYLIFKNSKEILDNKKEYPYILDGLVYTAEDQIYTPVKRNIKYNIYKWKPKEYNSIDFYLKLERGDDGKLLKLSDKENRIYCIGKLHVGHFDYSTKKEVPVLFNPYKFNKGTKNKIEGLDTVHLYLDDKGKIRDNDGTIINDRTVIECYYDEDETLYNRWQVLRSRYDKTNSVKKFKRKYGNNEVIASKVWNSIQLRLTEEEISRLANPDNYENEIQKYIDKIDSSDITSFRQSNRYYQKSSNLMLPLRQMNNFIKTDIIFRYCSPKISYINDDDDKCILDNLNVLDYACGRGGDHKKFHHRKVTSVIGFDIDYENLFSPGDSASSRYNKEKEIRTGYPFMEFMMADGREKLDFQSQKNLNQKKIISDKNKKLLIKYFGENPNSKNIRLFDIISCQFAVHYMFKNDQTLNNFIYNCKRYLKNGGYVLITTTDSKSLEEEFQNNDGVFTSSYIDEDKNKKKLVEFKRNYQKFENKTGLSIDYHNASFMDENNYVEEYMVPQKLFVDKMYQKGFDLVDTMHFDDYKNSSQTIFDENIYQFENPSTRSFFENNVKKFFDSKNKSFQRINSLYRYYIFQKNTNQGGDNNIKETIYDI